ncbi:MAG: tRNA pseudouridine(55) synthase TruB [Candidatus Omnitrophota bacterium]
MLNGILLIDKPKGLTSYKVVEKVTRNFHIKKAGHLGTLDPMATGLLLVCLNEATKIVQFMMNKDKEYEATLLLGTVTDTGDITGKTIKENKKFEVSQAQIRTAFKKFTGTYLQTPPMHSAIKQNGKKLYKLAHKGEEIERKKRKITVYSLKINFFSKTKIKFTVACSKGTYIRSLVSDIGEELGCGATLADLRRTKVGNFSIKNAKPLEELLEPTFGEADKKGNIKDYLIDIKIGLTDLPELKIKNDFLKDTFCGTPIYKKTISDRDFKLSKGLIVKVLSENGQLISVSKCIRDEEDIEKLAQNGIVFNHMRVFKPRDEG